MKTILFCLLWTLPLASFAQPKVVHVFVALCDNASQGIVPVPATLGKGNDPANNLYWGARYGIKTYLKLDPDWELLSTEKLNDTILERCIFKHKTHDVFLVADAYKGSLIRECITDFLSSTAGNFQAKTTINGACFELGKEADLLAYIGHDGLMEFAPYPITWPTEPQQKECIILACISKDYFQPYLNRSGAKPLVLTTGLMAPEAYTLAYALDAWMNIKTPQEISEAAALGYHTYQKCGLNAAKRLLVTGK